MIELDTLVSMYEDVKELIERSRSNKEKIEKAFDLISEECPYKQHHYENHELIYSHCYGFPPHTNHERLTCCLKTCADLSKNCTVGNPTQKE
jgi:hypothetical protein